MRALIHRGLTLALRLGPPVLILRLFNPEVLGQYYVFTTFFTLAVVLISLESSVPFARIFLRAKTNTGRRTVYLGLVASQLRLASVLSPLVVLVYALLHPVSWWTASWLFAFLTSEALVNESGRFFWNCGETKTASKRDLRRAALFSISIILGIQLDGAVVSPTPLALLTGSNLALFLFDFATHHQEWTDLSKAFVAADQKASKLLRRTRRMMANSKSQLVHMQLLSAVPFVERLAIEKAHGLQIVGAYSFLMAIVSSAATLFLLPKIASARSAYLGATGAINVRHAHVQSIQLLLDITLACATFVLIGHFAIPWITDVMHKTLPMSDLTSLTAFAAVVSATYASAVAPMFANPTRLVRANLATAAAMIPVIGLALYAQSNKPFGLPQWLTMGAIITCALMQIIMRAQYARMQGVTHG